ncbi:MAG: hypothetical protein II823_06920 [Kiritimatiellae bacterium]|nr:hypothetical protein [Kiritimatiellia bacterium]
MSGKDTQTILLRDVPGDVVRELDARADANFRSRGGEVLAILTAVCRGHVALPVSMDGATLAVVKSQDGVVLDDVPISPFKPEPLDAGALGSPDGQRSEVIVVDDPGFGKSKGGEVCK